MNKHNSIVSLITDVKSEKNAKLTLHEEEDLKSKQLDNQLKSEKLLGVTQDRKERKKFANKLYWFLVGFMVCVFFLLFLSGHKCIKFTLDNSVLIALITTTSANVIGIFIYVVKYLFHKRSFD